MNCDINYVLERKKVKNINLRIKSDGTVYVSANKHVPKETIDSFVMSKYDFIQRARKSLENRVPVQRIQYFSESEIKDVILRVCENVYPYFENKGIKYPEIKFRKMVSQWGNCYALKGKLTFNTNLMYAPIECIEYVVLHEFTHFLVRNHSKKYYFELEKVCPEWKTCRKRLKGINIR